MGRGPAPAVAGQRPARQAATADTLELGRAVKYLLIVAGVVAAVWAVDEHFATQRELRAFRNEVYRELAQVRADVYRVNGLTPPRTVLDRLEPDK